MPRKPLIAGNWKMNGLRAQLDELRRIGEAAKTGEFAQCDVLVCPPATLLASARDIGGDSFLTGGQDCHSKASGAHTGDISAAMLKDAGGTHVILGHSERRSDHGETDATVAEKTSAAWEAGLVAVVCVGETEAQRDRGETLDILAGQLAGSLPDGTGAQSTVLAYEPVWAIGTGKTPTVEDVATVHAFLRERLTDRFGADVGSQMRILYGGSVKPGNARELLSLEDVDGALVGGASLKADDFLAICKAALPA